MAHGAGDDRRAIEIAETIRRAHPRFESARKRLLPESISDGWSGLGFLDKLPPILEDSARRLQAPPHPKFDPASLRGMASSQRIAALIDRLEDVAEPQIDSRGSVWFMGSPICQMLAAEGADAIEPLLDALEHDRRFTRSFAYGNTNFPWTHLRPVSNVVEALLLHYYQLPVFRWQDPAARRAWLIRNKTNSLAARAFDLLAEDAKHPSVSELLARRATEMKTTWAADMKSLWLQWETPLAR